MSKQGPTAAFESGLPAWIVERGAKPGTLNITCPRKDCKGKAIVSSKWLTSRSFAGRSCTYCFKTNGVKEPS